MKFYQCLHCIINTDMHPLSCGFTGKRYWRDILARGKDKLHQTFAKTTRDQARVSLESLWMKIYDSFKLWVMSPDLCNYQGRQSRAKAGGDCCIQEKESSLFSASTGGRNLHVVWWQFSPLFICTRFMVFNLLPCGLLIYWLYHLLHLFKQIEEGLPLFSLSLLVD